MGVVFGQTKFEEIRVGYDFLKHYCIDNSVEIQIDYREEKLISIGQIAKLKVYNSENIELAVLGNSIDGMDSDKFNITTIDLDTDCFRKEFPEHILEYEQKSKDNLNGKDE